MSNINHFHGSDVEAVQDLYQIKKEDLINFSANVNPLGISPKMKEALTGHIEVVSSYPDRNYKVLREAIASYSHTSSAYITVGNGSTELISLMIQLKRPGRALVMSPTYSEYEREITLAGGIIDYFQLTAANDFQLNLADLLHALTTEIDLLVICNPNNPTSTAITVDVLAQILAHCEKHQITVMIDETYVEFAPDPVQISAVSLLTDYHNLIVLRGVSKFFAAPGLRLGYAFVGDLDFLAEVNARKNPWTLNSLAELAGTIMFSDTEYIENTHAFIQTQREFMYQELQKLNQLKAYRPMGNFILVQLQSDHSSKDFFEFCIRRRLMIRDCSSFHGLGTQFIRFCIMGEEENQKLLKCFREFFS